MLQLGRFRTKDRFRGNLEIVFHCGGSERLRVVIEQPEKAKKVNTQSKDFVLSFAASQIIAPGQGYGATLNWRRRASLRKMTVLSSLGCHLRHPPVVI